MLEMRVDTSDTSLGNFGAHVPNLSKLKLSNSIVSSVRLGRLSTVCALCTAYIFTSCALHS